MKEATKITLKSHKVQRQPWGAVLAPQTALTQLRLLHNAGSRLLRTVWRPRTPMPAAALCQEGPSLLAGLLSATIHQQLNRFHRLYLAVAGKFAATAGTGCWCALHG